MTTRDFLPSLSIVPPPPDDDDDDAIGGDWGLSPVIGSRSVDERWMASYAADDDDDGGGVEKADA
jgi:hypothetical protein